jgi:hypothetical protein
MKVFAHLSPTVPAIFVAAMGITLSVFLLHGAWVQGEPTPLLAAVGGTAGRVVADLPATVDHRASEPVREVAATPSEHFVPRRQQAVPNAHRVHPRARIGVARRAPTAAPRAASPLEPATQVTMDKSFAKAPGKARGHGHGQKWTADARAPGAHGHGKAFGHLSEHHHGPPPGHAKQAWTAPSPTPTTPPKVHGGGNGHKGGKK